MADEETPETETIWPDFPTGRVKRIMKIDKDINKVNSEALFMVTCATQRFLEFLAERSAAVATEKKRKIVKLDHLRLAVKRHHPTADFLLDSLPPPVQLPDGQGADKPLPRAAADKAAPPTGTRRIDSFFSKPVSDASS